MPRIAMRSWGVCCAVAALLALGCGQLAPQPESSPVEVPQVAADMADSDGDTTTHCGPGNTGYCAVNSDWTERECARGFVVDPRHVCFCGAIKCCVPERP